MSTADTKSPRTCPRCNGTKTVHSQWAKDNGYEGPEGKPCPNCNATGEFPGLDITTLVEALFTSRGGTKRFRKSFASAPGYKDRDAARAYYVWRLARFHGGADVTMPVTADLLLRQDPFKPELDFISEQVAKRVFGTDMAAAYRWANALGYDVPVPANQPASAHSGGPVVDDNKPEFEQVEMF